MADLGAVTAFSENLDSLFIAAELTGVGVSGLDAGIVEPFTDDIETLTRTAGAYGIGGASAPASGTGVSIPSTGQIWPYYQ